MSPYRQLAERPDYSVPKEIEPPFHWYEKAFLFSLRHILIPMAQVTITILKR